MQPVREVYSLLMPVQDGRIIVPRAAVAEVTGYVRPKERPADAPDFLLGFIDWQGQKIPLVSFEAARGRGVPELGRRTRIAIVFGIAGRLNPDVFAVVTQGYPYLVRVNENVLQREEMNAEPLMLARVRMANEKPYIPDFEKLEMLIADCLGLPAGNAGAMAAAEPVDELDAFGGSDEEELDVGLLDGGEAESDDAMPSADGDAGPETSDDPVAELNVDLGEVTAFGTETNYSAELDALSDALTADMDATEPTDADDAVEINVDLDEVTVFGTETNYAVELDELSSALEEDKESEAGAVEDYAIDLSGLELDDGEADGKEAADGDADKPQDVDEFDFSGLNFELDDDEKKPE